MTAIINYFLKRSIFVNLLTFIILLMGGYIAATMNRAAFPNIDFDIIVVTTIWPGASPRDVERLVTAPLEETVDEVDGIKDYRSTSIENRSEIVITIDPDVDDTQKVIDDVRSALNRAEDLPADAEEPILIEVGTSREPVIEWALSREKNADGEYVVSYGELRSIARRLELKFLQLDGVARVERKGWRDAEIFVDLDPARLRASYIGPAAVVDAIRARNISLPGGEMEIDGEEMTLRTANEFATAAEISRAPIRGGEIGSSLLVGGGTGVRIGDVAAKVYEDFEEPATFERIRGEDAISLTVVKRESADILDVTSGSREIVAAFRDELPEGVYVDDVNDISYFVRRRLGVLVSNGAMGLGLVVISLFFFIGWRTALMVSLGIPISFGVAFIAMGFMGVTLNLISMFGLIIVIGIVVDDAIIVSENFYRYLEMGLSPYDAAVKGTAEVVAPVTATIATTVAAFAPMMFMTGIFGKFVFTIPLVVIIAILASLFECFFILPSHLYDMNRAFPEPLGKHAGEEGGHWFLKVRKNFYEPALAWGLRRGLISIAGMIALFVFSIALMAVFGSFKLFPSAIEAFYVRMELRPGSTKERTLEHLEALTYYVEKLDGRVGIPEDEGGAELEPAPPGVPEDVLDTYFARAGISQKEGNDPFTRRGSNHGMMFVYLTPENSRERTAADILEELRVRTAWMLAPGPRRALDEQLQQRRKRLEDSGADVSVYELADDIPAEFRRFAGQLEALEFEFLEGGPPQGKDIAIEITGDDFDTLQAIAAKYEAELKKIEGIVSVGNDYETGKSEFLVTINEQRAAQVGVQAVSVATALNTAFEGAIASSIRRPDEEVDIRVRFAEEYRDRARGWEQVYLQNREGLLVPVVQLIDIDRQPAVTNIKRLDGRRLITVTANITPGVIDIPTATAKIRAAAADIPAQYPDYQIDFGGQNEDTEESLGSLLRAFGVGIFVIFMILASLFRSLVQPIVILTAIPFSLIGVALAFVAHGEPLSFLAFMGIVGLSGVVVNDSIVLVSFANSIREENPQLSNFQVILEAGSMRLRPVVLTSITTVGGLLPTAYGIGGDDPFLKPMALAFAWGLLFSTVLILGLVPILYLMVANIKDWFHGVTRYPDDDRLEEASVAGLTDGAAAAERGAFEPAFDESEAGRRLYGDAEASDEDDPPPRRRRKRS